LVYVGKRKTAKLFPNPGQDKVSFVVASNKGQVWSVDTQLISPDKKSVDALTYAVA